MLKALWKVFFQCWRWLLHPLASEQLSYLSVFPCRQVLPVSNRKTGFYSSIVLFCRITFKLGFWFSSLFIPKVVLPALTFYDWEGCISKITKWLFQVVIFSFSFRGTSMKQTATLEKTVQPHRSNYLVKLIIWIQKLC